MSARRRSRMGGSRLCHNLTAAGRARTTMGSASAIRDVVSRCLACRRAWPRAWSSCWPCRWRAATAARSKSSRRRSTPNRVVSARVMASSRTAWPAGSAAKRPAAWPESNADRNSIAVSGGMAPSHRDARSGATVKICRTWSTDICASRLAATADDISARTRPMTSGRLREQVGAYGGSEHGAEPVAVLSVHGAAHHVELYPPGAQADQPSCRLRLERLQTTGDG